MANRRISEFPEIAGLDLNTEDLLPVVHVFEVDPTLRNKKITLTEFRNYLDQYYANVSGEIFPGNITLSGNLSVSGSTNINTLTASGTSNFNSIFVQNNANVSGTCSGNTITGNNSLFTTTTVVSGGFQQATGITANFVTGVFQNLTVTTQTFSGAQAISGDLTVLSGFFVSGQSTLGNNLTVTGNISGQTITGTTARFTNITGVNIIGTTQVSGATVTGTAGRFTNITGQTLTITTPSGATPAVVCSGVISGGISGLVFQGPVIVLP